MNDTAELAPLSTDPGLRALAAEVERRLAERDDPAHDLGHLLRVARWTARLSPPSADRRAALAAALLHDAVQSAKDDPEAGSAAARSAQLARELLPPLGFSAAAVDEIAEAIEDHSWSRGAVPRSELGRALQDADRLDALGAIGLYRALACGERMGAALYDADDPWAERRELDERRFTVDHFFTKLLRLPGAMHSGTAHREAEGRAALMRTFLERLGDEIGRPLPPRHRADAKSTTS